MDQFRRIIAINLVGATQVAAHVSHRMISNAPSGPDKERGVIVNTCSIASFEGQEGMGAYTAAKAALAALTLVWARDLSHHAIRVNAVAPGFMDTDMTEGLQGEDRQRVARRSALQRLVAPADVAESVLYLLSDAGRNVTGTVLTVDAGATA